MTALKAHGLALPGRLAPTDLALAAGSLTALVGPNGAGKTSLLHALAGVGRPAGRVHVRGRVLGRISPALRPSLLGYVPASREIAWPLTVRDLVTLTAPRAPAAEVAALLDAMALAPLASREVGRLSTGERSRVLIARALLPRPAVLLLDEPFANLDPLWQLRLAELLQRRAAADMAVLFSAHDLDFAARLGERMLVVDSGRCVADGEPSRLMHDGTIARVFGVEPSADGWRPASTA